MEELTARRPRGVGDTARAATTAPAPAGTDETWRVWVTEADVRAARAAWLAARDGNAPLERVLDLLQELDRLSRTLAYQAAGGSWTTRTKTEPTTATRRSLRPAARLSVLD